VNDDQYGRLVYKQSGIMSSVLTVNDMMSEWIREPRQSLWNNLQWVSMMRSSHSNSKSRNWRNAV